MVLTFLLLIWVNIERRKKEEFELEIEEKEHEVEQIRGQVHLEQANLLKEEYEQKIQNIDAKYRHKIEELIRKEQQLRDESEQRIRALEAEKQSLIRKHQHEIIEKEHEYTTQIAELRQKIVELQAEGTNTAPSQASSEMLVELQALAEKRLEDERRLLQVKERQLEVAHERIVENSPILSKLSTLEGMIQQLSTSLFASSMANGHQLVLSKTHTDILKQAFTEAQTEIILFCSKMTRHGLAQITPLLEECLRRGVQIDLVIGTSYFLNESRLHLPDLIQLLEIAEQYENLQIRSRYEIDQEVLICDENWSVLTSAHWLGDPQEEDLGVQLSGTASTLKLKETVLKHIQQADFLHLKTDRIKAVGKRNNEILIKLIDFKRALRLNSRFIEQIIQELQTLREQNAPVQFVISEHDGKDVTYVGHRPTG